MSLEISNRQSILTIEEDLIGQLETILSLVLEKEEVAEETEVSLSFVDPEEIQELNRTYRNRDMPTDVLSFPASKEFQSGEVLVLGDVVISTQAVTDQAEEYGHSEKRELAYLFVHGLLHLLGYDHLEESEKSLMRKKEEEILQIIDLSRKAVD